MGFAQLTSASAQWLHESEWSADYSESGQGLTSTFYGDPRFVPVSYRNADHTQQASQELRLTSEGDSRFQWLVGAFYSNFESIYDQNVGTPAYAPLSTGGAGANPAGILYQAYNPYHIKQYALFTEDSYRITDTLKATVGVRGFKFDEYVDYEQEGIFTQSGNATPFFGSVATSASGVNPKFNLSYEPNRNLTVYGQIAKGFRPGGVNLPAPVPPCANTVQSSYSPDSIWDYEVGEKARLLGGRLTVNADVFYIRWNNVQQNLTLACSYPFTSNVGTGESYGPEIEVTEELTRDLSVSFSGSYTQSHILSVLPALLGNTVGSVQTLEPGLPVLNVPRYAGSVALNYAYPIYDNYKLTARLSADTTGPFYDINYYIQPVPGYTLADARIGLVGGPWGVYLFGQNLTNKIAILTTNTHSWSTPEPSINTPAVTTPRTIGVEVNYKF